MKPSRESIFSAFRPGTPDQDSDVRLTLDAHVASVCADIRNRGRLGRALPIDPPSRRRADQLLADEATRFQIVMLGGGA